MSIPAIVANVRVINKDKYTRDRQIVWDPIPAGVTGIVGFNVYRSEVSYADFDKVNTTLLPIDAVSFNDAPPVTSVTPFQWWYKVTAVNDLNEESSVMASFPATDQDIDVFIDAPTSASEPKAYSEQNKTFPTDGPVFQTLPSTALNPRWFLEIRKRHKWLLEMGGKDVYLLKRRYDGVHEVGSDAPGIKFDPLRYQARQITSSEVTETSADSNFGTSWIGGYHTPLKIKVSFTNPGVKTARTQAYGVEYDFQMSNWTLWEPNLLDRDILVRQDTNERFEVINVTRSYWRGLVLHQRFELRLIEPSSIIYKIPVP